VKLLVEIDRRQWTATEFRCGDLSVFQIIAPDPEQNIRPEHVSKWRIAAGPVPRERIFFPDPESAMYHALTLERLKDEARA